jgi:hypothetical protein
MPERIVVQMPLTQLWDESGTLPLKKRREVGRSDVAELLRGGSVSFVIADCGRPLNWVPHRDCYRFWKNEVKPRLVEPDAAERGFRLEEFPGQYCYVASEWGLGEEGPVVVLETYH